MDEIRYASNGKGNLGVTLGAIGTGLGVLGNNGTGGLLGGLLGGGCNQCGENAPINRYDMSLIQSNTAKDSEIALLKADKYTDSKFADLNDRYSDRFRNIEQQLAVQAVHNAKVEGSFDLVHADMKAVKAELYSAIANEAEKRCCGDSSIVTYANATFYPKLVADITAATTTTAQAVYNPIPNCGTCCCK